MHAPALYLQAQAHLRADRPQQALDALTACVDRHPAFGPAFLTLAELVEPTQPGVTIQLLTHALDKFPEFRAQITPILRATLPKLTPKTWHLSLERAVLACMDDPQPLARFAARLLLLKHSEPDIMLAEQDPLWHAFLTRCINVDPAMEARIQQLRQKVGAASPLLPALALQAFSNEYLQRQQERPATPLHQLLDTPLIDLPNLEFPDGEPWNELARRTREDLIEERRLAAALPSLAPLADATSLAVAAQYEANPYPRWQAPPAPAPRDLRAFVQSFGAKLSATFQVLVAGCGTGFEAIDLARTDPTVTVTALDLSRASLAYAQRMANELGVTNLRFLHGDLLDLHLLDERFDFVTSTGVLHHIADPAAGLAALVAVTRPGGLLRLSLYSHRARELVRTAHRLILDRGWQPVPDDIRAFRRHVLSLPLEAPLALLRESDDFYTLSGCRDLVFHVHERQFTLPEVAALTGALNLVGFDASQDALSMFRDRFGDADRLDLRLWGQLEQEHPALFAGMYQLLVRAPSST
ncbi:class I SAM-dependent methyltransferase [Sphingomonas sp. S2-65]|uniref:class I SAM-dependent methyltransferase n=1 Tax=Sphingomonas sp. S2-65 TaxID=2903960 RepID=UPI001F309814|nr:class I SAM-dependent methyltransferase [Sphingomonas sp. S2-65]UYY58208.1 class I SAM-dependent methyltransferase [Sphingomonas sp. S2-65]